MAGPRLSRPRPVPGPALTLLLALAAAGPAAADLDLRLETETRLFTAQSRGDAAVAAGLRASHAPRPGEQLVLEAFVRADAREDARSRADLREAYYEAQAGLLTTRLGARRVYWGVAESRHLVDTLNQSDLADDLDGETKLGQPMLEFVFGGETTALSLYALPGFRERRLPGPGGPIVYPFPLAPEETRIEAGAGLLHADYAARASGQFGDLDLALSWFDGIGREPDILPCLRQGSGFPGTEDEANCALLESVTAAAPRRNLLTPLLQALGLAPSNAEIAAELEQRAYANLVLVPVYQRERRLGLEAQYIHEALALKFEGLVRDTRSARSYAAVAGFEYNLSGLFGSAQDLGLIVEALRDTQPGLLSARYDHEVFLGGRWSLNDVAGSQALGGVLIDSTGAGQTWSLEASRRLGDDWKLGLRLRAFTGGDPSDLANVVKDADELRLTLERYF
ncbi:hypothetical protein ED208_05710 [Stagnimonas aquatica]|uniref:DUF1302 family protein n=1 Tax=Stagnimonas aquatica TaxID=2689987 RepID=A0A3N0VGQ0_9GAMM|nr:hypothetical protein [Stagnimonas aquatica]ROH91872.1 hypothetical protein ED208_05710 [Stagnimonas aquatica]